jgi:hypothetical protein
LLVLFFLFHSSLINKPWKKRRKKTYIQNK